MPYSELNKTEREHLQKVEKNGENSMTKETNVPNKIILPIYRKVLPIYAGIGINNPEFSHQSL